MKKWLFGIIITFLFAIKANGQIFTQTYVDKCTGEIKTVTTNHINGNTVVSFYNQIRTFTPAEVQSGAVQTWLNTVYAQYNSMACPTSQVVQQAVQNTVSQAASQAASTAASSAASSSASSAASSSASSAASSSASPTTSSTSQSGGSSSSNSSQSEGSSASSETKSESKTESKSESKEESKSESNEENKEEKKEEKKKGSGINPMILQSDLTSMQNPDGRFNLVFGVGWSRASMAGDETFSANGMIWSNLRQFAVSGGYTKMEFDEGKLKAIHSYGTTVAYLDGNYMNMLSYTYVKPDIKRGTYGYNLGMINMLMRNPKNTGMDFNLITSAVFFWTKPYQYSKKVTLSPQTFLMLSPITYNTTTGNTLVNRHVGFLIGTSIDYKISKRFGFGINYKANLNTMPGSPILHNILVGSRMIL